MFGPKFQAWQDKNANLVDGLGALGVGLSQWDAGQPVDMIGAWDSIQNRRAQRKFGEAMRDPALLAGFTPEQKSMLAQMPPQMAQQLIMEKMFAPPPDPVKPNYDYIDGFGMVDMNNPPADMMAGNFKPAPGPAPMSQADRDFWGIPKDDTRAYVVGKDGIPEPVGDMPKPATSGAAEYGLQPVLGTDADGNTVIMQLGKDGTAVVTKIPEGVKPDIALAAYEKAQGTALGKSAGETQGGAAAALPGVSGLAGLVSDQVKSLKEDPYLPDMLGPMDSRLPNVSADAARVQSKIDQLQGGAFLQARQLLKGGGAITDFEGQKAEAAFVRMNTAQNEEDFKAALDDFNDAVQAGVKKLEAQAAGPSTQQGSSASGMSDEEYLKSLGLE